MEEDLGTRVSEAAVAAAATAVESQAVVSEAAAHQSRVPSLSEYQLEPL
jgi:hypothetical protein